MRTLYKTALLMFFCLACKPPKDSGPPASESGEFELEDERNATQTPLKPISKVIANVAGMYAAKYRPTNRSTFLDVSKDGSRVALIWLHNENANGAFSATGEPTVYASVGNLADPKSFHAPKVVGVRKLAYAGETNKKYNSAHNAPFVIADRSGGFIGLTLPNNANGYAQKVSATGHGYLYTENKSGSVWSAPTYAKLANPVVGSSLSEMTGGMDSQGNIHLFGQGHLGQFQGGFGYQRRKTGSKLWESFHVAQAYRPDGMNYFIEGAGFIAHTLNSLGNHDLHIAFAWNKQGSSPMNGLYYLTSADNGVTWKNIGKSSVGLPLKIGVNDETSAISAARLSTEDYSGLTPGSRGISITATHTGVPLILKPHFTKDNKEVYHMVYTFKGGKWVRVAVGPALFWNTAGNAIAYNSASGRVNVLLLETGNANKHASVYLFHQPLADVFAGKANWKKELVVSVPAGVTYASSLRAVEVRNKKFVALFETNYRNPGPVTPMLVEAPIR